LKRPKKEAPGETRKGERFKKGSRPLRVSSRVANPIATGRGGTFYQGGEKQKKTCAGSLRGKRGKGKGGRNSSFGSATSILIYFGATTGGGKALIKQGGKKKQCNPRQKRESAKKKK